MPLNRVSSTAWNPYSQNTTNFQFGNATYPSALIFNKPATNATGLVFYTQESGSDILTTRDSTGNTRLSIADTGILAANAINLNNIQLNSTPLLTITNNLSSTVPMWIRAASSQTADIIQWQNSAGTVLGAIGSNGTVIFGGNTVLNSNFGFTLFNKIGASYYTVNDSSYFSAISFARGNSTGSWMSIGSTGDSANGISNIAIQNGSSSTVFSVSQTGATTLPRINFSGGTTTISALTLADGTVSFEGTAGQLFSISNSLTGTIFSINDISGLPSVEVTDLGIVKLNELYGQTVVGSGTPATSAQLSAIARTSATIPLVVRGTSGQSANLQEWQNNTPTTVAFISNTGAITAVDLTLSGNLTVNGTTTNINTVNLVVEDKNIVLGDVASPSTTTADGGGITLLAGGSNKTFNWINATDRWTSSVGLEGSSIVRTGGTASQFLKADGSVDSSTYITGNQSITLSGDVTGSGTTAITTTLANSGATAGTYKSVTVDVKGRVTGGTNPTTLSGYGITDALDTSATAQTKSGNLTVASIIRSGGTSTQFLKADGSVDSSTYLTSASTLTAGNLSGTIPSAVLANSSVFIGTTSIALNRGTGALSLTGVSIDGSAGSVAAANITGTTLASGVTASSLTSVGTLTSLTTSGAINLNYASPTIASNNASAASIFTSTVTGITIGSSTIRTTAFPADGTTATAAAGEGYMGMPQVQVTSGGRTLAATDAGKHIYMTTTSGQTLTIPANSAVAFPVGTTIVVVNANTISTSIAITTDTLRLANSTSTGTRTLASNGMCTLLKIANTEWIASGNGLT